MLDAADFVAKRANPSSGQLQGADNPEILYQSIIPLPASYFGDKIMDQLRIQTRNREAETKKSKEEISVVLDKSCVLEKGPGVVIVGLESLQEPRFPIRVTSSIGQMTIADKPKSRQVDEKWAAMFARADSKSFKLPLDDLPENLKGGGTVAREMKIVRELHKWFQEQTKDKQHWQDLITKLAPDAFDNHGVGTEISQRQIDDGIGRLAAYAPKSIASQHFSFLEGRPFLLWFQFDEDECFWAPALLLQMKRGKNCTVFYFTTPPERRDFSEHVCNDANILESIEQGHLMVPLRDMQDRLRDQQVKEQ